MIFRIIQIILSIIIIYIITTSGNEVHARTLRIIVPPQIDNATEMFLNVLTKAPDVKKAGLTFERVPYGSMGSARETIKLLKEGVAHLALAPSALLPGYRDNIGLTFTTLISYPSIATDALEQFDLQDSVIGNIVAQEIGRKGLVVITYWNRVAKSLLFNKATLRIADIKGVKVGATGRQSHRTLLALGAKPTSLAFGEVHIALQKGSLDAAEFRNDPMQTKILSQMKGGSLLADYQQYQGFLLAAEWFWINLSEQERVAIQSAAEMATAKSRSIVINAEQALPGIARNYELTYAKFMEVAGDSEKSLISNIWLNQKGNAGLKALNLINKVKRKRRAVRDRRGQAPEHPTSQPKILFATNRENEGNSELSYQFGIRRKIGAPLSCGEIVYSPVASRKFGEVYPGSITLGPSGLMTGHNSCASLVANEAERHDGSVILFFHGYRNSFDSAVRRAIGFAQDFALTDPVLVWSWPSQNTMSGYNYDIHSIRFSHIYLEDFSSAFFKLSQLKNISVIAHSMGSQLAMKLLKEAKNTGASLANLVFVAPDVPKTNFNQGIIHFGDTAKIVTLYANEHDRALILSDTANDEAPAGLGGKHLLILDRVETVDVSRTDDEGLELNHSYGFDVPKVAEDVSKLVRQQLKASARGLPSAIHNHKSYWFITP